LGGVAAAAVLALVGAAEAQAPGLSPRVRGLIGQMSLDEKIALTVGTRDPSYHGQSGYTPGVPRLGIPPMRWGNGPSGLENAYETTAVPPPTAVASTFDPALARRLGDLIGLEGRYTGVDVINGPDVGVTRLSNGGGGGYGEDPYLGGRIAESVVRGIQSHGVMATVKHYVAYAQALHAGGGGGESYNFIIDDRTLHEIYLPHFEAAVKAGTGSIMAAYNITNGYQNAGNPDTLNGILRGELGFKGFVESDWGATHSTDAITKGLDVEFAGGGATARAT
jgi:beta-glucosidase